MLGLTSFLINQANSTRLPQVLKQLSNKGVAERKDYEESKQKSDLSNAVSKN